MNKLQLEAAYEQSKSMLTIVFIVIDCFLMRLPEYYCLLTLRQGRYMDHLLDGLLMVNLLLGK